MQLGLWAKRDGTGRTFDSSGGFVLPNGAVRSPDASWVSHARLAALTAEQRKKFLALCPDFVIELRSPTDSLPLLQDKLREYVDNGARLGWLIDPLGGQVFVYRPDSPVERLQEPDRVSADPLLPGFRLEMDELQRIVHPQAG
jgi:Uma2 family endonuclease